jgi:hypothetical protein
MLKPAFHVRDGVSQERQVVAELAEAPVAGSAEKTADQSGEMAVIDARRLLERSPADAAGVALACQHRGKVVTRYPVLRLPLSRFDLVFICVVPSSTGRGPPGAKFRIVSPTYFSAYTFLFIASSALLIVVHGRVLPAQCPSPGRHHVAAHHIRLRQARPPRCNRSRSSRRTARGSDRREARRPGRGRWNRSGGDAAAWFVSPVFWGRRNRAPSLGAVRRDAAVDRFLRTASRRSVVRPR